MEKYLTIREASNFLKISTSTLNRLIKHNNIPSYNVGDRRLFDRDELVEWARTNRSNDQGSSESRLIENLLKLLDDIEDCMES